jgi:deazaflavin-dependent oxidoreductase (nitroreductase family)
MGDKDAPRPGTRKLYKFFNKPPRIAYALGLGPIIGRLVLLLTTRGRKTGLLRVTPLQYEQIEGKYYVGSAFGTRTDWYRNILADPGVRGRQDLESLAADKALVILHPTEKHKPGVRNQRF